MSAYLEKVKKNLNLEHDEDDALVESFITAAISYAEGYQHVGAGYYQTHTPSGATEQGIIMLASFMYESRDGATGGFYSNLLGAPEMAFKTVDKLLILDKEWKV